MMLERILTLGERIDIALKAESIKKVVEYLSTIPLQNKSDIIHDLNELITIHAKQENDKKIAEADKLRSSGELFIADLDAIASKLAGDHSRYNGGWFKTVTGLNKNTEDGYSLRGDFVKDKTQLKKGTLILDCSISGSRKNQVKRYALIKINSASEGQLIATSEGKTWAIDLWEAIEKNL